MKAPGNRAGAEGKNRDPEMTRFSALRVLLLRTVLGVFFAFVLTRLFRPSADAGFVAIIAALLVFSAYLLEALGRR